MYSVFFFYGSGDHLDLHVLTHAFPTRRSSDLAQSNVVEAKAAPPKGGFDFRGATWPGTSKSADKAASTNPEPAKIPVRDVPVARMPAIRRNTAPSTIQAGAAQIPAQRELKVRMGMRSEERRVGKECVSRCRSRWSRER